MIAGARVEVAPYKDAPMDFVLWKPSDDATPGWDSPWGRGRPGWHIECSAMADELLWKKPLGEGRLSDEAKKHPHVFDIHGGGLDLQFPHHEDEIAQSCCANGTDEMARYWLHNEMLQVEGKKMSKSLGNFFTVRDLLDQGVPGEVIRFVMLSTHYRKPMDWTRESAETAKKTLQGWRQITEFVKPTKPTKKILAALTDDLNTSLALSELEAIAERKDAGALKASANLLGLLQDELGAWSWERRPAKDFKDVPAWHPAADWLAQATKPLIVALQVEKGGLKKFSIAGAQKFNFNFPKTDFNALKFNFNLPKINVPNINPKVLEGIKRLGEYYDRLETEYPAELALLQNEPFSTLTISTMNAIQNAGIAKMVEQRQLAKAEKNYAKADELRALLNAKGFELSDTAEGPRLFLNDNFDIDKLEEL